MKKIILFVLAIILPIYIYSCSSSRTDIEYYRNEEFSKYKIDNIAILPLRDVWLNIEQSSNVDRYFLSQLSISTKKYTLMGPEDCIDKLSKDSLGKAYYNYLVEFASLWMPNKEIIKEVGAFLQVDAIIIGKTFNYEKIDGLPGYNKGETRCNLRYILVSTKDGILIWGGTVAAYETTTTSLQPAPHLMNVIKQGMDKILENMFKK